MQTRLSALCLAFMLAVSVPATGTSPFDYAAVLENAFKNVDWQFPEHFAFTEISTEEEQTIEASYDPRRPADARWELLSIDGRTPTDDERADFRAERTGYRIQMNHDDDGVLADIVRLDTVKLVEESATHWLLGFEPDFDADDEEERRIFKKLRGEVRVSKAEHRIESLSMRNDKAIRPVMVAKISKFALEFGFTPVDDAVVLSDIIIAVKGSAFIAIRFDETETIRYRNFERVL